MTARTSNAPNHGKIVIFILLAVLALELLISAVLLTNVYRKFSDALFQQLQHWSQRAYLLHDYGLSKRCSQRAISEASCLSDEGLSEAFAREQYANIALANKEPDEAANELKIARDTFKRNVDIKTTVGKVCLIHELKCDAALASTYMAMNKLKEAASACEAGILRTQKLEAAPAGADAGLRTIVDLNQILGEIEQGRGNPIPAKAAFERALTIARGSNSCFDRVKPLEDKLEFLSGATEPPSVAATPLGALAQANADMAEGHYQAAIDQLTKAIKLKPDKARYYRQRAHAYEQLEQYENALRDYSVAIQLTPKPAILYARAKVYEILGMRDLARADREKANELRMKKLKEN